MRDRLNQIKTYLVTFLRLFINTAGWKVFIFGAIISAIIAWVVGENMFVYTVDSESGCFALVSACIWIGIFNSIQAVCKERDIIKREHRGGLHISSYLLARGIYEFLICLVQALIMVGICAAFMKFPVDGLITGNFIVDMFITYFIVLLSSDYLGLAISCIVKTTTTAMTVMPFILIIQLVLSGVLFKLEGNVGAVAKVTISKWGMEALGSISNIDALPYNAQGLVIVPRDAYLFETDHVITSWLMMALFAVIYMVIGILFLKMVDKDKR